MGSNAIADGKIVITRRAMGVRRMCWTRRRTAADVGSSASYLTTAPPRARVASAGSAAIQASVCPSQIGCAVSRISMIM